MIKAVLFDLGNVIVPVDFRSCHQALARVCSHPLEKVPKLMRSSGLVEKFEQGEIEPPRFYEETCRLLGMSVSFDEFSALWSKILLPEPLISEELVLSLKRRHRLLVLSNTNSLHWEFALREYPLLRRFDGYVLSYKVGAMKPSPAIYQRAVEMAGCRAEECFFTDDVPMNVEAARQAGMDAALFESPEKLEADLRSRGISL